MVEITKCPDGVALGAGDLYRWRGSRFGSSSKNTYKANGKFQDWAEGAGAPAKKKLLHQKQAFVMVGKVPPRHKQFLIKMTGLKRPTDKQLKYLNGLVEQYGA